METLRTIVVTYDDHIGVYNVAFMENLKIVRKETVLIYHELGIIISNWLVNGR